ncbi:MAG: DUF1573 domain-containing protein [Candidatus Eisenbacteria bacterium]|nr:DUF1573 domain-containing protein [Candidatus Eisenbacteria bacterium]
MRLLIPILIVSAMLLPVAQGGGVQVAGPVVVLDPPVIDFGTVKQEATHRAEVQIANRGTERLEIRGIESDCGCTVAQLPDSTLEPGETVALGVTLSTRHFSGQIAKHILLATNDPGAPKAKITLKAFVREMVRVRPTAIDFGAHDRGETDTATVTIHSLRSDSLRVLEVVVPEERVRADVERRSAGDSLVHRVTFHLRPDAPVGAFRETAVVRTSHRLAKSLKIEVAGQILSFFRTDPPEISLGQVREGQTRSRSLLLRGAGEGNHRVTGARCSEPALQIDVAPVEPGRVYEVVVRIPPEMPAGRIDATLRVTTDDPAQPEILVPVRGSVRRARR